MVVYYEDTCEETQKVPGDKSLTGFMANIKFFTHYSYEILDYLYEAERHNIIIEKRSDQMEIRPDLIKVMKTYAKMQEYSQATLYLGIYILDVYMDNYVISDFADHQKLIAIIALFLAAKSEDLDQAVPSIQDILLEIDMSDDLGLDLRFKDHFDSEDLKIAYKNFAKMYAKLEFLIFESMSFNTIRSTVVTFVNIFQNVVVLSGDELTADQTIGDLRVSANEFIQQLLEIIVNDVDFQNIRPSELAAAVIASTRKLLNIKNYWNQDLAKFTRYEIEAIRPLILVLMEKRVNYMYESSGENFDVVMKDSGYISPTSASETEDEVRPMIKRRRVSQRVQITYGPV